MSGLTILGASARAAAVSARRAGLAPWCADLFADSDLQAVAVHVVRCPISHYPSGFLEILRDAPNGPWMYTGGLENDPDLIHRMTEIRPLWGNGAETLHACRSPETVERILHNEGLPAPRVWLSGADLPADQRWLRKPRAGSAGLGIAFVDSRSPQRTDAHYFQQFVEGVPMSAVFVRARDQIQLIGVSEQLIGTQWLNADPFHYAGNIGPVDMSDHLRSQVLRIGQALGGQCGLLGLFGVDFVLNDDRPWVVEVNPRYPASVEVHERATGISAMALHRKAFDPMAADVPMFEPMGKVVTKGIIYARKRIVAGKTPPAQAVNDGAFVTFADIPMPGEVIEAGWPVLTVLTHAETYACCRQRLVDAAVAVDRHLCGTREQVS